LFSNFSSSNLFKLNAQLAFLSCNSLAIFTGKKVLLVEDNEINRFIAIQSLVYLGFNVTEAENGLVAINCIQNNDFDLILMDIQMPVMDGLQATTFIRENLYINTPIIALTANAFKHDIELYLERGMNDYITKPYDENEFFRKIEFVMQPSLSMQEVDTFPLFNLETIEKMSRGNADFTVKTITIFIQIATESSDEIQECIRKNNWKSLKSIAHKIKPSIDQFDIVMLKDIIRWLESYDGNSSEYSLWLQNAEKTIKVLKSVCLKFEKMITTK